MGSCKVYAIYGNTYEDFILYMAAILQNCGLKLLIADCGSRGILSKTWKKYNWGLRILNYRGIDYTTIELSEDILKDYDLIFLVQDDILSFQEKKIQHSIFITDYHYSNVIKLKRPLHNVSDYTLILRDFLNPKLTIDYLFETILDTERREKELYILPFDYSDYSSRLELSYDHSLEFRNISSEFRHCLLECAVFISGIPSKELRKSMSKAERGMIRC